jgi:hypothetical protein
MSIFQYTMKPTEEQWEIRRDERLKKNQAAALARVAIPYTGEERDFNPDDPISSRGNATRMGGKKSKKSKQSKKSKKSKKSRRKSHRRSCRR